MQIKDLKGGKISKVVFGETRVVLTSRSYDPEDAEPVYGSDYECVGTVITQSDTEDVQLVVDWDNGESNTYYYDDLSVVGVIDNSNPNRSFRRKKAEDRKKERQRRSTPNFKGLSFKEAKTMHKDHMKTVKQKASTIFDRMEKLDQHDRDEYDR